MKYHGYSRIVFLVTLIILVLLHSCQKDLELNNIPNITDEVEVGATYAVITGTVECSIATAKLEVRVYPSASAYNDTTYAVELTTGTAFELTLTNLLPTTDYSYRYIIYSSADSAELELRRFTTKEGSMPTVKTIAAESIRKTSAVCGGEIINDGGYSISACGVCWSTTEMPTLADSHTSDNCDSNTFVSNITNLSPTTTYYFRAYATNEKGTAYGEQRSFVTSNGLPKVFSYTISEVTASTATFGGGVISNGGYAVTARGTCWSTSENPTIADAHTVDGNGLGEFTSNITGLSGGTVYYARIYATNENGTSYGMQQSFITIGTISNHDYVDLGLPSGLKWATCNVGANNPWEYGHYFAWGETNTKAEYTIENCSTYTQQMGDISGNPSYDAATANWGGTWRMPTKAEMEELINNCAWLIAIENGVYGAHGTGPNGNSIFLPAAGEYVETLLYEAEVQGSYMTSTPFENNTTHSYALSFQIPSWIGIDWFARYCGRSIRPVSN